MFTKKAQVKFVEIFGVLVVFIFLVVIAIAFFSRLQNQDIEVNRNKRADIDMVETANVLSGLSEIQCSLQGTTNGVCIDKYRFCALKEMIEGNPSYREYYATIFGLGKHIQIAVYDDEGVMMDSLCNEEPEKREALFGKMNATGKYVEVTGDTKNRPIFKPMFVYDPITKSQNFAFIEVYQLA